MYPYCEIPCCKIIRVETFFSQKKKYIVAKTYQKRTVYFTMLRIFIKLYFTEYFIWVIIILNLNENY